MSMVLGQGSCKNGHSIIKRNILCTSRVVGLPIYLSTRDYHVILGDDDGQEEGARPDIPRATRKHFVGPTSPRKTSLLLNCSLGDSSSHRTQSSPQNHYSMMVSEGYSAFSEIAGIY